MSDKDLVKDIVGFARLKKSDVVLEIGYGKGALTKELAKKCKVIAIDIEPFDLSLPNVIQVEGNILKRFDELCDKYAVNKIVANIPYMLSEPLFKLIFKRQFDRVVLTVGKDFANVLSKYDNRLGIIASQLFDFSIVKFVSPDAFFPKPRVDSAVIMLEKRARDRQGKIYAQLIALDHKKLRNAFEKILVDRTKREIKDLTTMDLFNKKLYELNNQECVLLDKFVHLL